MKVINQKTIDIIKKTSDGKIKKSVAAKKLDITRNTIYRWINEYHKNKEKFKRKSNKKFRKKIKYRNKIIEIVKRNPKYGPKRISEELQARYKIRISNKTVWLLLKEKGLKSRKDREIFAALYQDPRQKERIDTSGNLRLKAEARKRMIEEVVIAGKKSSEVTREFNVSRKTFAKWKKRYLESQEKGEKILTALEDRNPAGVDHPRAISGRTIRVVLDLVVDRPDFSSHKIAKKLGFISNHGVQGILSKYGLNKYEKRLVYSQSQTVDRLPIRPITSWINRIKLVFDQFLPSRAPAPPPTRLPLEGRWAGPPGFLLSLLNLRRLTPYLLLSILLIISLYQYGNLLGQASSTQQSIGYMFAVIALSMGSVFFLYSLKYYFTLAIVLSFSREVDRNLSLKILKGKGSWFLRLFGMGVEEDSGEDERTSSLGGLDPNISDVELERYPFISVHLPMFNEVSVAERLLKACTSFNYSNQEKKSCYEVIVVDDSTNRTTEIVKNFSEKWNRDRIEDQPVVKVIHRKTRRGFKGGALQEALRLSDPRAEFIVVFDADFIPYSDTLGLFVKYFQANVESMEDSHAYRNSKIAAIQGYQWHVLNKSENWLTRGVRTEYAGNYVVERSGTELYGGLKQIAGSVYMVRRDLLDNFGWGYSITEDFQLTLKLYRAGYKVLYTPYIQAPAECAAKIVRLIRQRMRWAEGHSFNIKKSFAGLLVNDKLSRAEKLEFLYLSPYYLQAFFFLLGTISWILSETLFRTRLPFWTSIWGWSLVLTNLISLPLMNAVGMFLEEAEERDFVGIFSFVAISYLLVPFQAYASVKGFLEREEGYWFRTPKTGKITDIFKRGRLYRLIRGMLPGSEVATLEMSAANPALALTSANSQFDSFKISYKRKKWVSKIVLAVLLIFSVTVYSATGGVVEVYATPTTDKVLYIETDTSAVDINYDQLTETSAGTCYTGQGPKHAKSTNWILIEPDTVNNNSPAVTKPWTSCDSAGLQHGWIFDTQFDEGLLDGNFTFKFYVDDNQSANTGYVKICAWSVNSGMTSSSVLFEATGGSDIWTGAAKTITEVITDPCGEGCSFPEAEPYLVFNFWVDSDNGAGSAAASLTWGSDQCGASASEYPQVLIASFAIPENVVLFLGVSPVIPMLVRLLKKRKEAKEWVGKERG